MVALNKRQLRREIERARREQFRARLVELRELIKAARKARDEAISGVRSDCALKRRELSESCKTRAVIAKASGNRDVSTRRTKLLEERGFEEQMLRAEKPQKLRSTFRQRQEEDDDAVRRNLDPTMVPVFDQVRKHIKGGPRKTRTEAFLQWAEENPDEIFGMMQHDADRYLAQLLAEQERTHREMRRKNLAGVPF